MGCSSLRKAGVSWLSKRTVVTDIGDPFSRLHPVLRDLGKTQTQTRPYFGLANLVGKAREYRLPPYPFTATFCSSSSSSASTASSSRVGFIGWYLAMIRSRPVLTKSVTSSIIYIAADLSSQTIAGGSSESYDFVRTSRMAAYGLLILGPTLHYWFNLMSRLFPQRDLITTLKKMALGQTVYGPMMTTVFFSLNAHLQGESGSEIIARLKRDLLPTMLNGIMYWPFCDFITFKFCPVYLQPLVSNSFSYIWTIYITYMASREKASTTTS